MESRNTSDAQFSPPSNESFEEEQKHGPDEDYTSTGTDVDLEEQTRTREQSHHSRTISQSRSRAQSQPPLSRLVSHISFRRHRSQPGEPAYEVKFDDNDPANPRGWSSGYKACITMQLGFLALVGSVGSSIISPAEPIIAEYTGVSQEVTVLVVALYVLGFAVGPMAWAPISEVYGRRWSMLPAIAMLALFSIGTATSKNAASIFITRFLGGVFGSAPISNVSAALGDLYEPKARGIAITFYAVMVVGGPTLGPVVGAGLTNNASLGWRWTEYLEAIFAGSMVALTFFFLPELYSPVLLKRKAARLRKETGDQRHWHPHEAERITLNNIFTKYFSRPLRMLFTEPMVTCIACYASYVYGILYMTLEVFPIVFREQRGYGLVVSTLPFLGMSFILRLHLYSLLTRDQVYSSACSSQSASISPINPTMAKPSQRTTAMLHLKPDYHQCSLEDASSQLVFSGSAGLQTPNSTGVYLLLLQASSVLASIRSFSSASTIWWTLMGCMLHQQSLQTLF